MRLVFLHSPGCLSQLFFWFQVNIIVPLLRAYLSPTIYESALALISHLDILQSATGAVALNNSSSISVVSNQVEASVFGISFSANVKSVSLHVDLANDGENSSVLIFSLQELDIRFVITT